MRLAIAILALTAFSCETNLTGTDPSGLHVEISVIRTSVHVGENVPMKITNRSTLPIFVGFTCAPTLERLSNGMWETCQPAEVCIEDLPTTVQIWPGDSYAVSIPTASSNRVSFEPGTYRGAFQIAAQNVEASTHRSREFIIEPAP